MLQSLPCSVTKLIAFVSASIGKKMEKMEKSVTYCDKNGNFYVCQASNKSYSIRCCVLRCDRKKDFPGATDYSSIRGDSELQNISILDARKHNPGTFSQTGFTLIKLEEVLVGQNSFLSTSALDFRKSHYRN